ncbi:hypothetical protein QTH97_30075 [Variovorax sp. J22R24]|uniref:hypothetical protein n=1 Tax=Variovorax gracilis TaxID=3053502 RepID=UPI002575303F|nr:hypothetical protein [Variovorax sp. J22R24]MDM0109220.1 hypothetical protein [Variovorax sp. J22R24]
MAIPIETADEIFVRCATAAMLIQPGDALPLRLRDFGLLVADECAEVVRGFRHVDERDAGDSIREAFGDWSRRA